MRSHLRISPRLWRCLFWTGALLLLLTPMAFGQGCALCYTQAAHSTQRFIQALRSGIIILMLPPFLMSIGLTVIVYHRRNEFNSN